MAVYFISRDNFILGIFSFVFILFIAYRDHKTSHNIKNIFSIIHHYHHENDNFLSHFSQIILEFAAVGIFLPLYYIFGTIFFNPWVFIFFILFYSSVHNINYSLLKVNGVHKLHHECTTTNIGPDICDIIYGTKHPSEAKVENTDHYIPNIIFASIIVLILQYFWKNDTNKKYMLFTLTSFILSSFIFLITTSFVLWSEHTKLNNNNNIDIDSIHQK